MLLVALAGLLTACGSNHEETVETVASTFYGAVADGDGEAACSLLAPATRSELEQSSGKPCAEAVVAEQLPRVGEAVAVDAFGTAGEVRYEGETAFLGRFDGGWKVLAAGCTPKPPHPYDCKLTGG